VSVGAHALQVAASGRLAPLRLEGRLELDGVSLVYPGRPDVRVLDRLTLRVNAGECVALVGPSGGGKSEHWPGALRACQMPCVPHARPGRTASVASAPACLPNRDQMPCSTCQLGLTVSYLLLCGPEGLACLLCCLG
jgi:hypothetical protein